MQLPPLTREQVRSIDRRAVEDFGITSLVLMENAGRGGVDKLCELGIRGKVVIVCGKGNNGGDGFVIARHLDSRGYDVQVVLIAESEELRGDAAVNYAIIKAAGLKIVGEVGLRDELDNVDWIVDGLLGTGASGDPRPPISTVIEQLNASNARKLAVDLPSGLDCDTGIPGRPTFAPTIPARSLPPRSALRTRQR